ncbi:CAB/ELIP/HLIP superfamily protein [Chondrocystis sp. NIES-4102]|nr:CAB/ELIP/HLIP superfamily protein [Chondrocystis sp. NIES-4102]
MDKQEGKFGFTDFAEIWNGRLAMIGFVSAILLELNTGHGVLAQFGLM